MLLVLQALQIWGTNFNYMATRINTRMAAMGLPSNNRSHRQVKLKYKREEKAHPKKVTAAINGQVRLCAASRSLHTGCVCVRDSAAKCLVVQFIEFLVLGYQFLCTLCLIATSNSSQLLVDLSLWQ